MCQLYYVLTLNSLSDFVHAKTHLGPSMNNTGSNSSFCIWYFAWENEHLETKIRAPYFENLDLYHYVSVQLDFYSSIKTVLVYNLLLADTAYDLPRWSLNYNVPWTTFCIGTPAVTANTTASPTFKLLGAFHDMLDLTKTL